MRCAALAALALLGAAACAAAAEPEVHGYAKLQPSLRLFGDDNLGALLVGTRAPDLTLDLRLDTVWRFSRWDLTTGTRFIALDGDSAAARHTLFAGGTAGLLLGIPSPDEPHAWLHLTHTFSDTSSRLVFARFDRLSVGYTGDHLVLRLGRQALSWGGGLVFQVLDLFNPFPPTAIDTDTKPGTDMLSAQWLFPSGDDLQAVVVPRRPSPDRNPAADFSSVAFKWHHFAGSTELELLAAGHYDRAIVGGGASGNLAGGVWRVNATYTARGSGGVVSFLANLDHSWVWGGRNAYGFVEVFRNGFGVTNLDRPLATLPASLLDRLARGELFSLGRHELATGLQLDWTPRLRLDPTVLLNLDDDSAMVLFRARFNWFENVDLDAGFQEPLGPRGTEYGGVPVAVPPSWAAPGRLLWARLAWYF